LWSVLATVSDATLGSRTLLVWGADVNQRHHITSGVRTFRRQTFRRQTFWSWLIFKPLGVPDERVMSFLLILLSFQWSNFQTSMRGSVFF